MRLGSIPELADQWVVFERLLHDSSLDAPPSTVNEADLAQPGVVGGANVLLDNRRDVAGGKRVQVQCVGDRNSDWWVGFPGVGHIGFS